jgi:pimeloyl-ACP methyl ester carboxylesterase
MTKNECCATRGRDAGRNIRFVAEDKFVELLLAAARLKCPPFMHRIAAALALFLGLAMAGCERRPATPFRPISLKEARSQFQTRLLRQERDGEPVPAPPEKLFRLVKYKSPVGELSAYLGTAPTDRRKSPAIIWLVGGFSNGIGDVAWTPHSPDNDQSASAFRQAGILMMYPSLRGGNDNPGVKEGFYGEIDDVVAASDYLASLEEVDPSRIYLGGHSTGGTLALLAAEYGPTRFRAIFAFGPVVDPAEYGADLIPFSVNSRLERKMRAPGVWLNTITIPTYVIEGTAGKSNIADLTLMEKLPHSAAVTFIAVPGVNHFSILAPVTKILAQKINSDGESAPKFNLLPSEIVGAMPK